MFAIFHAFTQTSNVEPQTARGLGAGGWEQQRQREAAQRRAFAEQRRAEQACKRAEEERRWDMYRRQRAQKRASAAQERRQKREPTGSRSRRRAASGANGPCFGPALAAQAEKEAYYAEVLALGAEALTPKAVRESYRRLAAKYHPDKVAHLGEKLQALAAAETRRLNEAYAYFRQRYNF